jgi:hypothetical protein
MHSCTIFPSSRRILLPFVAASLFVLPLCAQTVTTTAPAGSTVGNVASPVPNLPAAKPAWHDTKIPADKEITAKVEDGVLTVDGLVAKVQLNYDIHHAGYLYFFVPGVGTAIVSRVEMYGSSKVKDAFNGSKLAFNTGGHSFELSARANLGEKGDVFVRLDTDAASLDRYPMVGYGDTTRAPYNWPLSAPSSKDTEAHLVAPPPIPANLLPRTTAANVQSTTRVSNGR